MYRRITITNCQGGIELGESTDKALRREVKEEVGADIEVLGEIGAILEYRNEFKTVTNILLLLFKSIRRN